MLPIMLNEGWALYDPVPACGTAMLLFFAPTKAGVIDRMAAVWRFGADEAGRRRLMARLRRRGCRLVRV